MVKDHGFTCQIRNYLEDPLTLSELHALQMELDCDISDMIRQKESAYSSAGLSPESPDSEQLAAIAEHPLLLQRPIVIWKDKAIIARPPSQAFELLPKQTFSVRETHFAQVSTLAQSVLIDGTDKDPEEVFSEWRHADIVVGCFEHSTQTCVGSALLFSEPKTPNAHEYRLRGMAVDHQFHGVGLGRRLFNLAQELLEEQSPDVEALWCNARTSAVPFYQSVGMTIDSEPFEVDDIGMHVVMRLQLKK